VRAGLQTNFNDDPVGGSSTYFGPYGQSSLSYQFGPASALSWTLRYGTEPSGLAEVSQRQTFRTGLVVVHAITARISASLNADYQRNYYDQAGVIDPFFENVFGLGAGLKFAVTRLIALEAGYQFSADLAPDDASREYTRNVVFVGVSSSL
jgi:opacity protein-like surface antigen